MFFKRIHDRGTESVLTQYSDGWRIRLQLREADQNPVTIAGYLSLLSGQPSSLPTLNF